MEELSYDGTGDVEVQTLINRMTEHEVNSKFEQMLVSLHLIPFFFTFWSLHQTNGCKDMAIYNFPHFHIDFGFDNTFRAADYSTLHRQIYLLVKNPRHPWTVMILCLEVVRQ